MDKWTGGCCKETAQRYQHEPSTARNKTVAQKLRLATLTIPPLSLPSYTVQLKAVEVVFSVFQALCTHINVPAVTPSVCRTTDVDILKCPGCSYISPWIAPDRHRCPPPPPGVPPPGAGWLSARSRRRWQTGTPEAPQVRYDGWSTASRARSSLPARPRVCTRHILRNPTGETSATPLI